MNAFRQLIGGLLAVIVSFLIVAGAFSLALVESGARLEAFASPSNEPTTVPETHLPDTILEDTPTATIIPSPSYTLPTKNKCDYPLGWMPYMVQGGDTLDSLAQAFNTTSERLFTANCLHTDQLQPGWIIYVPPITAVPTDTPTASPTPTPQASPTPLPTSRPCGPPAGWVRYTVQPGDNLYRLSQLLGVTIDQLQLANCMGSSITLRLGSVIYVPFLPATHTPPPPTETPTIPPSPTPTSSETPEVIVNPTPTDTPSP